MFKFHAPEISATGRFDNLLIPLCRLTCRITILFSTLIFVSLCLGADSSTISPASLPSAGRHFATISISEFGFYAITAKSPTGVALQLIDPMNGPGTVFGMAGKEDGRINEFLDEGEYRLIITGAPNATGDTALELTRYMENSSSAIAELPDGDLVETSLVDFEYRSYWISIDSLSDFFVLAAGRSLTRVELWRQGGWVEPVRHHFEQTQPSPGKPLQVHQIARKLSPGRYRLTFYAGAPLPWASGEDSFPLYIRRGLTMLGDTGRIQRQINPTGIDMVLFSGQSDYVRAELLERNRLDLDIQIYNPANPFVTPDRHAEIEPEAKRPFTELNLNRISEPRLAIIRGTAGIKYNLQNFQIARERYLARGLHWLSTTRSGNPVDNLDQTMILVKTNHPFEVIATRAIPVTNSAAWARQFNITRDASLHLEIKNTGDYTVLSEGPETRFKLEPVIYNPPPNYSPPPFRASGYTYSLDAGYYILTMQSEQSGVLKLAIGPPPMAESAMRSRLNANPVLADQPQGGCVIAPIRIPDNDRYLLSSNLLPDEVTGICLRPLPFNLEETLSFFIQAGQTIPVPNARADRNVIVRAISEDGTLLDIAERDGTFSTELHVAAGEVNLQVRNPGNNPTSVSIVATGEFSTDEPSDEDEISFLESDLPILTEKERVSFEGDTGETRSCLARIDDSDFYVIESTGLLAVEVSLSSRTIPGILTAEKNGPGRNAALLTYLRAGDYQVSLRLTGGSRGHFGVRLTRAASIDAGHLTPGNLGRTAMNTYEASRFSVTIPEQGIYRVDALGLNQTFALRVEDTDGWPVLQPGTPAGFSHEFDPGDYSILVLPSTVESRCLLSVTPVRDTPPMEGHGPHSLSLGQTAQCRWLEPLPDQPRLPDVWTITIPAPITATISLSSEMEGTLRSLANDGAIEPITLQANRAWTGPLNSGDYQIDVVCSRLNNALDYEIRCDCAELVDGVTQPVSPPARLNVSASNSGLVILRSNGTIDVKGRLFDPDGWSIAASDDLSDDWNFLLSTWITPGICSLTVEPATATNRTDSQSNTSDYNSSRWNESNDNEYDSEGEGYSEDNDESAENSDSEGYFPQQTLVTPLPSPPPPSCSVSMIVPDAFLFPTVTSPYEGSVGLNEDVMYFPVEIPVDSNFLIVRAESFDRFLCMVVFEPKTGGTLRAVDAGTTCQIEVPVPESMRSADASELQVYVGLVSLSSLSCSVDIGITAIRVPEVSEADLNHGVSVFPVVCNGATVGIVSAQCDRPGLFELVDSSITNEIRVSPDWAVRCTTPRYERFPASSGHLWLATEIDDTPSPPNIRCRRVHAKSGIEQSIKLECPPGQSIPCDLDPSLKGPAMITVFAQNADPGIQVSLRDAAASRSARGMASGESSAVTLAMSSSKSQVRIWNADPLSEVTLDARMTVTELKTPVRESFPSGPGLFTIPPGESRIVPLGNEDGLLTIAVDESAIAALLKDDMVEHVIRGDGIPRSETILTNGGSLILANPSQLTAIATVSRFPVDPTTTQHTVSNTVSIETSFATAGNRCIDIIHPQTGQPRKLYTQGTSDVSVFLGDDGYIIRGTELTIYDSGALIVPHGQESVVIWLDDASAALWPSVQPNIQHLDLPASVALSGATVAVEIDMAVLSALHISVSCPAIIRLAKGESPEFHAFPEGGVIDTLALPGNTQISVRALNQQQLSGSLDLSAIPSIPITEGQGNWKLLSPGLSIAFLFEVSREGPVGIGIQSEGGIVTSHLIDQTGEKIGEGIVQMPTLKPGSYSLLVMAPANSGPIKIRPALAGLSEPGQEPPNDIIKTYLGSPLQEGIRP